jgi:3-methyladenine DNA glycosylase/8-oxoguanine DNA glycosylase
VTNSLAAAATRVWAAGRPVDVAATLAPLCRGAGDPAHRVDAAGRFWWCCRTPEGPGTIAISARDGEVRARAWGDGADWLLAGLPALLGDGDDWSGLDLSPAPVLAEVLRRRPGLRLPRTGLVLDSLVPAVLEQRVTGSEARRAWRTLLHRFGAPAPGPAGDAGMRVPPGPRTLLDLPTWEWHRLGVDLQRQRAVRAAATVADRLEECAGLPVDAAEARLRSLPGIGVWTAAETVQRALGAADAVSVGDYHIPSLVVFALTGRPRGTDEEMLAALAPWPGSRQRVVRLIELSPVRKPRFGPRFAPVDIRRL